MGNQSVDIQGPFFSLQYFICHRLATSNSKAPPMWHLGRFLREGGSERALRAVPRRGMLRNGSEGGLSVTGVPERPWRNFCLVVHMARTLLDSTDIDV